MKRKFLSILCVIVLSHGMLQSISAQQSIGGNDIDQTRIYITGYSAGGSGSWRMLNDNTSMFAAGCIASANPLMVQVANVAHTPVYAVAGSNDNIMDATKIEAFVNSLIEAGGEAQFDLLQGKDHFGTCNEAFTQTRLDWLFSHSRADSPTDIHQPQTNISQPTKSMVNGQIYITHGEVRYNIIGHRVHSNY